jgi:hypothetical protein
MVVLDTQSGKAVTDLPCIGHADDAFYDATSSRIYVSGGDGAVSVYRQRGPDRYDVEANVETGSGATTSLFVPELKNSLCSPGYPIPPWRSADFLDG